MRFSNVLEWQVETLIDMADWANKPETEGKPFFLALLLLCG